MAQAAKVIDLSRRQAYAMREIDPEFAAEWDAAIEAGTDLLEDVAMRRAVAGSQRNIYHNGVIVGQEVDHHDTLLIFLLKGRRPEKFRDRFDLSNSDGTLRGFAEAMRHLDIAPAIDDRDPKPTAH